MLTVDTAVVGVIGYVVVRDVICDGVVRSMFMIVLTMFIVSVL